MTRICMECQAVFGERCGKCGDASPHVVGEVDDGLKLKRFKCSNRQCNHTWTQGDDMPTHGLCEPCFEKMHAEARHSISTMGVARA